MVLDVDDYIDEIGDTLKDFASFGVQFTDLLNVINILKEENYSLNSVTHFIYILKAYRIFNTRRELVMSLLGVDEVVKSMIISSFEQLIPNFEEILSGFIPNLDEFENLNRFDIDETLEDTINDLFDGVAEDYHTEFNSFMGAYGNFFNGFGYDNFIEVIEDSDNIIDFIINMSFYFKENEGLELEESLNINSVVEVFSLINNGYKKLGGLLNDYIDKNKFSDTSMLEFFYSFNDTFSYNLGGVKYYKRSGYMSVGNFEDISVKLYDTIDGEWVDGEIVIINNNDLYYKYNFDGFKHYSTIDGGNSEKELLTKQMYDGNTLNTLLYDNNGSMDFNFDVADYFDDGIIKNVVATVSEGGTDTSLKVLVGCGVLIDIRVDISCDILVPKYGKKTSELNPNLFSNTRYSKDFYSGFNGGLGGVMDSYIVSQMLLPNENFIFRTTNNFIYNFDNENLSFKVDGVSLDINFNDFYLFIYSDAYQFFIDFILNSFNDKKTSFTNLFDEGLNVSLNTVVQRNLNNSNVLGVEKLSILMYYNRQAIHDFYSLDGVFVSDKIDNFIETFTKATEDFLKDGEDLFTELFDGIL